jgi:hypothetical protein
MARTIACRSTKDRQDWAIFDDGKPVGRIYEDAPASTPVELRWFWPIVVWVPPAAGIVTSGEVPTLDEAKTQFKAAWRRTAD